MNQYIDEKMWNEVGFECADIIKRFRSIKNPANSISRRIEANLLIRIKNKFSIESENTYNYLKKLEESNPEFLDFIHLLIYASNKLDEEITKSVYEKEFSNQAPNVQMILYQGLTDRPNSDLLRKIHYTTLIERRGYLTCSIKKSSFKNDLSSLDEDQAQKLIREQIKKSLRKKVNVWFVLKTDNWH